MITGAKTAARSWIAIAGSIAVHALLLVLLTLMVPLSQPASSVDERPLAMADLQLVRVRVRIEHRATPASRPIPVPAARPQTPFALPRVGVAGRTRTSALGAQGIADRDALQLRAQRSIAATRRGVTLPPATTPTTATQAGAQAERQTVPISAPVTVALARASESPATPAAVRDAAPLGVAGPFGANYPPALLPTGSDRSLRSAAGAKFTVVVAVDDSGHATGIRWLAALTDDALRTSISAQLLAATYVPAECDGLPCAGNYTLHN